jgi:hypothetical protein
MPKNNLSLSVAVSVITLSVFTLVVSCHKQKKVTPVTTTEDTGYASDQSTSEQAFNDVSTISDQAMATTSGGSLGYRGTSGCATVHHSADTTTIDFGSTNCMCRDGRNRKGKILVIHTGGHYADSGHVHTITFDNYFVNDNKGHNASGHLYFNIAINGAVILSGGRGTVSEVSSRVRTWVAGESTATDRSDDAYEITGSGSITRANGTVVSTIITAPLQVAYSCRWIQAGTIQFAFGGKTRTINYGSTPACDDQATVTMASGATRTITLP